MPLSQDRVPPILHGLFSANTQEFGNKDNEEGRNAYEVSIGKPT